MIDDQNRTVIRGLRNVAAAVTKISFVDPLGALYYLGYNIDDLTEHVCYEEVVYLLLYGKLPTRNELEKLRSQLTSEMKLPNAITESIKSFPQSTHPMEVLRTEISHLSMYDPDPDSTSEQINIKRALRLIAKVPTIVATIHRLRTNQPLITPNQELGVPENFLYLFRGKPADSEEKEAIDCSSNSLSSLPFL